VRQNIYYNILKFCNIKIVTLNNLHKRYAEVVCKNGGDILEVGFGAGTTSSFIQQQNIKTHTILEIDDFFFNKLTKWVGKKPNTIAIKGDWLTSIPKNKKYDGIILDMSISPDNNKDRKTKLVSALKNHTKEGTILVCTTDMLFNKNLYIEEGHTHKEIEGLFPKLKWYDLLSKCIPTYVIENKRKKGQIIYN
tara:strand:- start:36 stop:614 length:579 start_codon:yes stop_codon:yes gene_type:complete